MVDKITKEEKFMIYSEGKIKLLEEGNLLHRLYLLTDSGTAKMSKEEQSHLADMILRRGKERTLEGNRT